MINGAATRSSTRLGTTSSRAAAYRFAATGDLPIKRLGRRVYVVTARLRKFIEPEDKAA
jgi:hypothetical protein